jgi:hypothetical protein
VVATGHTKTTAHKIGPRAGYKTRMTNLTSANQGPTVPTTPKSSYSGTESEPAPGAEQTGLKHPGSLPAKTRARLQTINANCMARTRGGVARQQAICVAVQECYDALIEDRKETDGDLPESVLVVAIPQKVLELAVEVGWLGALILDESRPEPRTDPAKPPGKYRVEPAYRTWLQELLEPRAEYWRARVNAEPCGLELPKPEFVVLPLPATSAEGLVLQANERLKGAMAKEPMQFSQFFLIEAMIAAGVPPGEITIRRMLLTAAEVVGDPAVPIALMNDGTRTVAESGADPALTNRATVRSRGKRGPERDFKTAWRVDEIVAELAPNGNWRAQLEEICDGLDDAKVRRPKPWAARGYRTWYDCLTVERSLVVKAIEHHRERAREQKETFS